MTPQDNIAENFIRFLTQFVPLSEVEIKTELIPIVRVRTFGKKELVSKAGEIENYMNFIQEGLVRKYYKQGEDEHIVQLSREGHLITNQESFYTRTPSEYYLETIEATTFLSLTFDDMEKLFRNNHNFERLGRLVTVHTMVLKDRWQTSLIMQSPRERFLNFIESYPGIIQRVPQKFLASYLNIKPETFSRFKHLLRKRKSATDNK